VRKRNQELAVAVAALDGRLDRADSDAARRELIRREVDELLKDGEFEGRVV
jgi:hypothetical protein